jgi:hypothetical protein
MANITQWNCRGLWANYNNFLQLLNNIVEEEILPVCEWRIVYFLKSSLKKIQKFKTWGKKKVADFVVLGLWCLWTALGIIGLFSF